MKFFLYRRDGKPLACPAARGEAGDRLARVRCAGGPGVWAEETGQDSINTAIGPPFPITGGANNPNPGLVGQTFYGPSNSLAVVPVYDGHALNPGGDTVTVVGFIQLFVQDALHHGNDDEMDTVVLNVSGCASGGSGGSTPPVTAIGASPIPIRLIRTQ